jgi:hypothetical protein
MDIDAMYEKNLELFMEWDDISEFAPLMDGSGDSLSGIDVKEDGSVILTVRGTGREIHLSRMDVARAVFSRRNSTVTFGEGTSITFYAADVRPLFRGRDVIVCKYEGGALVGAYKWGTRGTVYGIAVTENGDSGGIEVWESSLPTAEDMLDTHVLGAIDAFWEKNEGGESDG